MIIMNQIKNEILNTIYTEWIDMLAYEERRISNM